MEPAPSAGGLYVVLQVAGNRDMFIHLKSAGLTYSGPDTVFSEYIVMGEVARSITWIL